MPKVFLYVLPILGLALLQVPVTSVLSGIYAKHFGLSLTTIAAVMVVAKVFDAITDPVIGYFSDRWRSKTGSRKGFIIIGGFLLAPCSFFLFVPPSDVSGLYFTFWYIAFYLAMTLFLIPYLAWANEFTTRSKDKTLVFSAQFMTLQFGAALFYLIPLLPFFISTDITPEILKISAICGSCLLTAGLLVAVIFVPSGTLSTPNNSSGHSVIKSVSHRQALREILTGLFQNKAFLIYIGAYTSLGLGIGMWTALFFIYVDVYLSLGDVFAELSLWGFVFGALAIPIWYRMSLTFGKNKSWLLGMTLLLISFLGTGVLSPGFSSVSSLLSLNMLMTFSTGSLGVIAPSILCDVIDYGRLKDSTERTALYFSVYSLMGKIQAAVGGGVGLAVVGIFGFDVLATEHSPDGLFGLRMGASWMPAFFVAFAMLFVAAMPLSERRMEIVRRRIVIRCQ